MDQFNKKWITENSVTICNQYADGVLTLRALYYQLVSEYGMTNSMRHYKRVCAAMADARRDGIISYSQFSDQDRGMSNQTSWRTTDYDSEVEGAKEAIERWMTIYGLNRWENQEYYPEVWIEKKALIGVFQPVCRRNNIALAACKGYPSLTFLNEASDRFRVAEYEGKSPIILYFGDYDPTGEDIPRSISDNMRKDFGQEVEVRRIALMHEQVIEWRLPAAPTKSTDSRSAAWDGIGQVELDAVKPAKMQGLIQDAIDEIFDEEKFEELEEREKEETKRYKSDLKEYVIGLADELENEDDEDEDDDDLDY